MKFLSKLLLMAGLVMSLMASADSVEFQGSTITYANATASWVDDELVLTYRANGTLQIPVEAKADYLVVGGGGSGGRGKRSGNKPNYTYYTYASGNGGEVKEDSNATFPAGTYTIAVGAGGAAPTSNGKNGNPGGASSLTGNGINVSAEGGAGGQGTTAKAGSPIPGLTSSISGSPVVYGQGGAIQTTQNDGTSGSANTGNGGQGCYYNKAAGSGGSGVVYVRIKSFLPQVARTEVVYTGRSIALSDFDGIVASVATGDSAVATVAQSGNTVTLTGVAAGSTTVRVTTDEKVYVYTVTVRDTRILEETVSLAVGAHSATLHTETFEEITSVSEPSTAGVVSVTRSGNTITFTALAAGTTTVTVAGTIDGIPSEVTYTLNVMQYANDVAQVGDSFISYTGATTNWVDGDLVLIYSDPQVAGTFEIPSPYTVKVDVLAVGGGGAGGTVISGKGQGGGGGGAGGYSFRTNLSFTVGTYNVSVGAGGKVVRTDEINVAISGENGSASVITNGFGYAFASAMGGGGGGAPVAQGNSGVSGGSGGGAAWYNRKAGVAGTGVDGQGFAGGSPTTYSNGGAGGGAAHAGGDWNQAGAGKSNDITGTSVTYAVGGAGGQGSGMVAAQAGQGAGFGGAGGNGGLGANGGLAGAGGDGVVVVRIKDVSKSVKVPLPTESDILVSRVEWVNGTTFKGLDDEGKTFTAADGRVYNWSDAIAYVDGVTNVTCSLEGETKVGIGYYNYTIYLKDGYVWDTEPDDADSYGSTDGQSHRWRIVEDLDNIDAEINVKKSVVNQEGSNATVRVESFSSPEISGKEEVNVLFLGTRCQAHGLTGNVIKESLNTISISCKANVDYFIIDDDDGVLSQFSGTLNAGDSCNKTFTVTGSCHGAIWKFYAKLDEIRMDPVLSTKYDYIVFEFDGSRLATNSGSATHEKEVASWLKDFYDGDQVIWIVDGCVCGRAANSSTTAKGEEPWGGTEAQYNAEADDAHTYWMPNSAHWGNVDATYIQTLSFAQYRGLLGLFDPYTYLAHPNANSSDDFGGESKSVQTGNNSARTTVYCSMYRNELQTDYNHLDKVEALLKSAIKPKPYNLDFRDKIVDPEQGLTIQAVTIQVCTNGVDGVASTDADDWVDLMRWRPTNPNTFEYLDTTNASGIQGGWLAVNLVSNLVTACFSNIDFQVWSKVDIDVVDDGRFRTNEGASYNNITGQWEKNPNEGQATVEMTDISDGSAIGVNGRADTAIPMKFNAYRVNGLADYGYIYVNGSATGSSLYISEGSTVPVYYRGKGGYTLVSVTVDGVTWGKDGDVNHQNIDAVMTNLYTFASIASDHEIHVVYEPYVGGVTSAPVTNVYDGAAHLIDVKLDDDWTSPYATEIRYTLDPNADKSEYMTEADFLEYCRTNNLAQTVAQSGEQGIEIFYEVFAKQPGYGDDFGEGWVWIDMSIGGSNYSVITPRKLVVTPDYAGKISYGNPFPANVGYSVTGFVTGEGMEVLDTAGWKVVSNGSAFEGEYIQGTSGEGQYKTHLEGVDASDVHGTNYILVTEPGLLDVEKIAMDIGEVPQGPHLDPEDLDQDTGVDRVIRVYDGTATNIAVKVTKPSDSTQFEVRYSVAGADGNPTEWLPMSTVSSLIDVGTNKVWYSVTPIGAAVNSYFAVTSYSYVITLPRPITVQAASDAKAYDGTPLVNPNATVVAGELAAGDVLSAVDVTGSQTAVGTSANTLNSVTLTNGAGRTVTQNYTVTRLNGELVVTTAPIVIGDTPHSTDPNMPNDYGQTGVEDVEITYDGTGTNIVVNVTRPSAAACTITYSTNGVDWVDSIAFTNVGVYQVWFHVEPPAGTGYVPVTNYGYVTINPREVVVTADDKECLVGDSEPTYTATVEGLIDSEKDLVDALIHYGPDTGNNRPDCPTYTDALGTYEIVVTGEENQGNYHVTYVNGTLTITDKQRIVKLWIVDHADAGTGKVHLAFTPTLNGGTLTAAFLKELETAKAIQVKCAATEAALETATPMDAVLRDGTGTQHLGRGWVWITVNVPDDGTGPERLWKVVITLPES